MTALVSCFARAYHNKNSNIKIYEDNLAEKVLSKEEYDNISINMSNGINFFNPKFSGNNNEALDWIINNNLAPSILARRAFTAKSIQRDKKLGLKQYLIFASGYDTYGYTDKELQCYEIDRANIIDDKINRVKSANIDYSNVKYIKTDFTLERGETEKNKHIPIEQLKQVTNYEMQEFEKQSIKYEKELETDNIEELKKEYKRVIRKFNTLANQYTKVKVINENTLERVERIERDYAELEEDYYKIEKTNNWLKYCLNKTFECVSILFDYPIERIKSIVNNFIKESKNNDRN